MCTESTEMLVRCFFVAHLRCLSFLTTFILDMFSIFRNFVVVENLIVKRKKR